MTAKLPATGTAPGPGGGGPGGGAGANLNYPSSNPSLVKRRRKSGKQGQGESSREASAESNDETATSDNEQMAGDDTDTASLTSPHLMSHMRGSFEETHIPAGPHHGHSHGHEASAGRGAFGIHPRLHFKRPQTLVAAATANSSMSTLDELPAKEREAAEDLINATSKGYEGGIESGVDESGLSTYDGDVSSAPTAGRGGPATAATRKAKSQHQVPTSEGSWSGQSIRGSETLPVSSLSKLSLAASGYPDDDATSTDQMISAAAGIAVGVVAHSGSASAAAGKGNPNHPPAPHGFLARLQAEELQEQMRQAIEDRAGERTYKINPPPVDRPVRIYADGVYDLFHFGHALQLRQCKLFFPSVCLLVGVCSDELVLKHKASPVLHSAERYESVRNCKWVDEVIEDAPWEVDQAFLDKHRIDYVAHDEEPYVSANSDDVYAWAKSQGRFLPTRRTAGVSTSELLQRIVEGYTQGIYDGKLEKIGARSLAWSEVSHEAQRNGGKDSRTCPQSPLTRPQSPGGTHAPGCGFDTPAARGRGFGEDKEGHLLVPEADMRES